MHLNYVKLNNFMSSNRKKQRSFTHYTDHLDHCAQLTKSYDLAIGNNCLTN